MTNFDEGTDTLRPPSGRTEHPGHGFMEKTLKSQDFRTVGNSPSPSPRQESGLVPRAVSEEGGLLTLQD